MTTIHDQNGDGAATSTKDVTRLAVEPVGVHA